MNNHLELCFQREFFDRDLFDWDTSIPDDIEYIILNEKTTEIEVGVFVASLLSFNDYTKLDNQFIMALHKEEELALVGGLAITKDLIIYPSCCLDIQDWIQWKKSLKDEETFWLGHNPDPWVEYCDNIMKIWSDEKTDHNKNIYCIKIEKKVFESEYLLIKDNIENFISGPLLQWFMKNTEFDSKDIVNSFNKYFFQNYQS